MLIQTEHEIAEKIDKKVLAKLKQDFKTKPIVKVLLRKPDRKRDK